VSETGMTTERPDEGLPERWSAQRKTEVVLRVIRGEPLDEMAREIQDKRGFRCWYVQAGEGHGLRLVGYLALRAALFPSRPLDAWWWP
jgi:hypothetical protein